MAWDAPRQFTLTEDHIKLLRAAHVRWGDGAPEIDAKRPYGDSDVIGDVGRLLEWKVDEEGLERIHEETADALQVILSTGSFMPGTYRTSKSYTNDWTREDR